MEYIVAAVFILLEFLFLYTSIWAFLPRKESNLISFIIIITAWLFTLVYTQIGFSYPIKLTITLLVHFAVARVLFCGSWYHQFLLVVLSIGIASAVDILSQYSICAVLGITLDALIDRKLYYTLTGIIAKLFAVLLAWLLGKWRHTHGFQNIDHRWLLLMLLFPAVSLLMLFVTYDACREIGDLTLGVLLFSAVLIAANVTIIYMINLMEKATRKAQETALLNQKMEIQADSIRALEKSYRAQREATHEYIHQMQTIYDLLTNREIESALSYIQHQRGLQTTRIFPVNSHHPIVDAVLNHKFQTAKEMNIDIQMQINDLSHLTIPSNELIVLLSNLLDNAIEGCCRLENNRRITCRIVVEDALFLSVRNTSMPVVIENGTILTTKVPHSEHGYGLPHICHILESLGAEYSFDYSDGYFQFAAEIPAKQVPQ